MNEVFEFISGVPKWLFWGALAFTVLVLLYLSGVNAPWENDEEDEE